MWSKLGQTSRRVKAEQWKTAHRILPILLFEAWRDGDEIPEELIPRGRASSTGARHQVRRAQLLHKRRTQYYRSIGRLDLAPSLEDCFSSRDPRRHYRQVLHASVAFRTLAVHNITPNQAHFAHELMETMCIEYVRMNVHLSPNFHQLLHLEEFILENGSLYNTHTWPFERANHDLTTISLNNRGNGILEGSMMRAWWTTSSVQSLVSTFIQCISPSFLFQ
jgi:hypothetical protein